MQFIFAGKAHPKDHGRQGTDRPESCRWPGRPEFRRRIVFLEDYDMNVARHLVQGVDVWLNNPRRPLEASGTSGMKVACQRRAQPVASSTAGGCEGYDGDNGWAIGAGEEYTDLDAIRTTSRAGPSTTCSSRRCVPLFYTRGADGLPRVDRGG